ncbi:MAG TPA: PhnD/SsuA/transferrin family substrate-binding protein, partial [Anaerolineaceae bacterium]|nr:PhnD/SsuA/transferrin family substrate-binding protein [Anaerolineaceae bacterium]
GFVNATGDAEATGAGRELAVRLTVQTGFAIQSRVFPSAPELVEALQDGEVHAAWLQPLTYLYAHSRGIADVSLLTNHFGTYYYGTQFFANVESSFSSYYDAVTNTNLADAQSALAQLGGKTPCWVDTDSVSGYILPAGILSEIGVQVNTGVIARTATNVIRTLYITGVCDFGATFGVTGDPRTASAVLDDLPDARERVMVLWRSDAIIPNLNLSFLPNLPGEVRQIVEQALVELVKSEEGKTLLSQANQYDIEDLRSVDDSIYDPIRGAVQRTNTDLNDVLGR